MCSSFPLSIRDRFQAWLINEMGTAMHWAYGSRKQKLFADLPAQITEIGPGAGANFRYYRTGTKIHAIEPNKAMHARLRQRAARHGLELDLVASYSEDLPLPSESQSCVVGTLVLCSVKDPSRALAEVGRVLRPGGRYVFLEHVAAKHSACVAWQQRLLRRPWRAVFGGCRVDQDTLSLIESADFESVAFEEFAIGWNLLPFSPHILGTAMK